jgi:hypothetical protein
MREKAMALVYASRDAQMVKIALARPILCLLTPNKLRF